MLQEVLLITITPMDKQSFKDYLFQKFIEWEKATEKRRVSFSAFARWLSNNSFDIEVKHQVLDKWINGTIPKEAKYIYVLAEKFGDEIYEILEVERPDPDLLRLTQIWQYLPEKTRHYLREQGESYIADGKSTKKRAAQST